MAENLDEILQRAAQTKVPRRSFLAAAGLLGGSAALAACGSGSSGASAAPGASAGASAAASADAGASAAPVGDVEKQLFMYNWSDYTSPKNIDAFKAKFGVEKFQYDTFANNEELLAKLQAGATGYDVAAPTAEYVPSMVEGGYIQKLDWSRIPNQKYIDPAFMGLAWDPNNEYQLPKDFGTTGVLYRSKVVKEPVTSWQEFYDLSKGKYSGKVVLVDSMGDVMTMPLKMIGKSLNSVEKEDLDQVRTLLLDLAPHILALDSDTYQDKLASEEAVLCLGWTGPIVELRANPDTADIAYTVPSDGTLFWLDTWVLIADAPNPNAAYAFINYAYQPEHQAQISAWTASVTPVTGVNEVLQKTDPTLARSNLIFPSAQYTKNCSPVTSPPGRPADQQKVEQAWASAITG